MLDAARPRRTSPTIAVRSLPLGWRQKLAFSVALVHQPRIVFLDEPTSGVDPITRRQFWELIYEAASSGHDRARDDALHGRSGILRPHLDHGRRAASRAIGTPAELKQRVRRRRRSTSCSCGSRGRRRRSRRGQRPHECARGLLRKEMLHILRDRRTLTVLIALPVVQVVLFGYAIRTDVERRAPGGRRSRARLRDAWRCATGSRRAGVFRIGRRRAAHGGSRSAVSDRRGAAGDRASSPASRPISAAASRRRLLIVTDATEPNTGSLLQAYAQAVIDGYQRDCSAASQRRQAVAHRASSSPRSACASTRRARARTCSCPA